MKIAIAVMLVLAAVWGFAFYYSATNTPTAVAQHSCTEDSWCWNPLINGNHLGYVEVVGRDD